MHHDAALLDFGRDEVDQIIREIGNFWWEAARNVTPDLLESAILGVANANRVDPGYLRWTLLNDRRSWENRSKAAMLDVAIRLFLASTSRRNEDVEFEIPASLEEERRVDAAVADVVKWADGPYFDRVLDIFLTQGGAAAKRIQRVVVELTGEPISEKQARLMILTDLPLRLRDHPFWFRDAVSLRSLMLRVVQGQ